MEEIWKDVEGFEGLYQVSNDGRIKSFKQWKRAGCPQEFILKPSISNAGYLQVTLYKDHIRSKFLVHRLVASAFVQNPSNLPHINHLDENKRNNRAENLEWCTAAYNNNYGTARFRAILSSSMMVDQYLPSGQFLARYVCIAVASEITGIPKNRIKSCCIGECLSGNGFVWKYVRD